MRLSDEAHFVLYNLSSYIQMSIYMLCISICLTRINQ